MRRRSTSSFVSPRPRAGADAAAPAASRLAAGAAAQPGQPVAQQGQLDLGLALEGVGVLGEDVEDHRGAVDAPCARAASRGCTAAPARARCRTRRCRRRRRGTAPSAPRPCPCRRSRPGRDARAAATTRADLVGAGGVDQQGELVEAGLGVVVGVGREGDADEDDLLAVVRSISVVPSASLYPLTALRSRPSGRHCVRSCPIVPVHA